MIDDNDFDVVNIAYDDDDIVPMPETRDIDTLPFIRCPQSGCKRVISSFTVRIQELVDDAHGDSVKLNGRRMSIDEYNLVITDILQQVERELKKKMSTCCKMYSMELLKVSYPSSSDYGTEVPGEVRVKRHILGSGTVVGNVKVIKLAEMIPHNQYMFTTESMKKLMASDESEEDDTTESSSEETDDEDALMESSGIYPTLLTNPSKFRDLFPLMPHTDERFTEDEFEPFINKSKQRLYGVMRTGLEGLETIIVRTPILAR